MLPQPLKDPLRKHLLHVREIHNLDLVEGFGRVSMPNVLAEKYPTAPVEWVWQWVFPQEKPWINRETGKQGRHHVDNSVLQKAVKIAVRKAVS